MLLKDKQILVIDDDMGNAAVIRAVLNREGARVVHDFWGDTALKFIKNPDNKIDLIVLDLTFPRDITGYDIFEKIRRMPEADQIPIVAVTAADRDSAMPRTIQMGFNGFINKPIDRNEFPELLREVIMGQEVWGA